MRVIAEGNKTIVKLWGCSAPQDTNFRLMHYLVRENCEDGTLLLNTVTGELILLSPKEAGILNALPKPYSSEMEVLVTNRFLVPEQFDELTSIEQLRKIMRNIIYPKDDLTGFMILPTTKCNARCFYCYESDYPHCSMNEETTEQLIEFIVSHCGRGKKVRLSWFGGEPTLGEKQIDHICDCLETRGISFTSSMISNGYLFTEEMAHKAREKWRLSNIQITLDGTEEIYNNVKAYVFPEDNPYQRVLRNIGILLNEGIRVSIRMNLDTFNAYALKQLVDELSDRFPEHDLLSVYVHEIFEDMGYKPVRRTESEREDVIEKRADLDSYIASKGLKLSKDRAGTLPSLKASYCMADNPTSVLVNPKGQLGKCQHVQFEHMIGNLQNNGIADKEQFEYWLDHGFKKGCEQCVMLPFCGIPEICPSGRVCTQQEKNRKLDLVSKSCHTALANKSG